VTELLLFGTLGDAVEKMGHAMLVRVIADQMMSAQMVFSVVAETAKKIFLMTTLGGAGATIAALIQSIPLLHSPAMELEIGGK